MHLIAVAAWGTSWRPRGKRSRCCHPQSPHSSCDDPDYPSRLRFIQTEYVMRHEIPNDCMQSNTTHAQHCFIITLMFEVMAISKWPMYIHIQYRPYRIIIVTSTSRRSQGQLSPSATATALFYAVADVVVDSGSYSSACRGASCRLRHAAAEMRHRQARSQNWACKVRGRCSASWLQQAPRQHGSATT